MSKNRELEELLAEWSKKDQVWCNDEEATHLTEFLFLHETDYAIYFIDGNVLVERNKDGNS
jgi:hypothetical protein